MKQLKSRSHDLRLLFGQNITVRHIAEFDLQTCQEEEEASIVLKRMEEANFDVLPLIEKNGIISGYVERIQLQSGPCRVYRVMFHPSQLVAESTPLFDILPILRNKPRLFILNGNRVNGIVTRGDLQKAPVRMLLFGFVTLLEMHLLRLVRLYYAQDSWQECLNDGRLSVVQELLRKRQSRNEAIDLADCLHFCDKRELVLNHQELRERLGFPSKMAGKRVLRAAEKLRNTLSHAQDIVAGSSWPEIIDLITDIEDLVKKCESI